jgi:outer membrane protein assembly factor BamB
MRAVEMEAGEPVWQFIAEGTIRSSPSLAEGVLYFGDGDGFLYALDVATGSELWRFQTDGAINASPALAPGVVFAASLDGTMYAVGSGEIPAETDTPVVTVPFVPATGIAPTTTTVAPSSDTPGIG